MIGVGLVGCGGMGTDLARNMAKLEGARLLAAYDSNLDAAKKVTAELGGDVCSQYGQLLGRADIDAVIVATPGYLHAQHVKEAAAAAKHVFCEKPLALSLRDCDDMIRACRKARVKLMVGQVLRLLPLFKESARIVREQLGKPVAMSTTRIGGWGYREGWRSRLETCGGSLLEVNVHEFDYMRYVLGEPVEAFAYGGRFVLDYVDFEDTVYASFKFRGGSIGILKSAVSSAIGQYRGEVICKGGTLFYDNRDGSIRYKKTDSSEVSLTRDQIPQGGGVAEEVSEFICCIEGKRQPSITGKDGRAAVEMALAVRRSAAEGAPVRIGGR